MRAGKTLKHLLDNIGRTGHSKQNADFSSLSCGYLTSDIDFQDWEGTVVLKKVSIAFELKEDHNYRCVRKDCHFLGRNQNLVFAADTASIAGGCADSQVFLFICPPLFSGKHFHEIKRQKKAENERKFAAVSIEPHLSQRPCAKIQTESYGTNKR